MSSLEAAILIASLLGLAAVGVALLIGMRPRIPPGRRFSSTSPATRGKVHVVVDPAVGAAVPPDLHYALLPACHAAWLAVVRAWPRAYDPLELPDEIVVLFLADEWFDAGHLRGYAAFQDWTGAFVGKGAPMLVVRASLAREVEATGEPVIHELLHLARGENLGDVDRGHQDPRVWKAIEGSGRSAQSRARELYEASR